MTVLDEDAASRRDLQESIEKITSRITTVAPRTLGTEADEIQIRLDENRRKQTELIEQLTRIRAAEHRPLLIDGKSISATRAAQEVHAGVGIHDWIPDSVELDEVFPLSVDELTELFGTNGTVSKENEGLECEPPAVSSSLLKAEQVSELTKGMNRIDVLDFHEKNRAHWPGIQFAQSQAPSFRRLATKIQRICTDLQGLTSGSWL